MHQFWLMKTLALAKERQGFCSPNPSVGAIVVENNEVISEACHHKAGQEHAELQALKQLNYPLGNATLYISLEPCSHWGKTPPCVNEIVRSGIKKVVYAFPDPNPKVKSFDTIGFLKEKGIECKQFDVTEINDFYRSYAYWQKSGRPFITLKIAQSMNGKIAMHNGEAVALTGEALKTFTHQKRKQSDVILTTAKTILLDDPKLNVRLNGCEIAKPIVALDRQKQLVTSNRSLQCLPQVKFLYCDKALMDTQSQHNFQTVAIDAPENLLDLMQVIEHIGSQGFHDVWVEAGGILASALLKAKLVNRMYVYISGQWLGQNSMDAYVSNDVLEKNEYKQLTWQQVGNDMMAQFEF